MKRSAYVLAVVLPVAALIGVRLGGSEARKDEVGRVPAASRPTTEAAERRAVDVGAARSRDFFKEDPAEATLDGAPATYQRALLAAATAEGAGDGVIAATDVVWISNPKPRNRHELERLVAIETRLSGGEAGAAVREAFGRVPSLRAARARVVGGSGLRELRRLELEGGATAVFVDPETPAERIDLVADALTVEFVDGAPSRAFGEGAVRVHRPVRGDAEVSGRGVEILFGSGPEGRRGVRSIVVAHGIVADLRDPAGAALPGPPIRVEAGGPLTWTPAGAPTSRPGDAPPGGSLVFAGGLGGSRGTLTFACASGVARFADDGGRLAAFEGTGAVSARDESFEIVGDRVLLEPRRAGRATLSGRPLKATLFGSPLPGAAAATATLTSAGPIVVEPSTDPFPNAKDVRRLHAAANVVAESGASRLAADDATLWFGTTADGARRPLKIFLARDVVGATEELSLKAGEASFEREYDAAGLPRLETLILKKDYEATFRGRSRFAERPGDPASRTAATGPFGLLASADRLVVSGADKLEAVRAPQDDAASLIGVRGGAEFRLEDANTRVVAARLACGRASLVVRPETADERGASALGPARRIESFSAEQNVLVEAPGFARGRGDVLRLRPLEEAVVLTGAAGGRAEVTAFAPPAEPPAPRGPDATFTASSFTWSAPIARLEADGGVRAQLALPRFPWIGDDALAGTDVLSTVACARATAAFDRAAVGGIRELDVAGPIVAKQPGRIVEAAAFYCEPGRRTALLSGSPIVYRAVRTEDGEALEDFVRAPRASLFGDELTVDGPVRGMIRLAPVRSALSLSPTPEGEAASARPTPTDVRCGGSASFRPEVVHLSGRASAAQGDPAGSGFSATGDEASFFFAPGTGAGRDLDLVMAVLTGGAVFRSRRLEAAGDVVKLDRAARLVTLYNDRPEPATLRADAGVFTAPVVAGTAGLTADFSKERVIITLLDAGARPATRPEGRR